MTQPRVVLVVPCYVEASRLAPPAFLEFLRARPCATLLFVDDGSRDATIGVLSALRAAAPEQVEVLHLDAHVGKGEAVRAGLRHALASQPDYVGYWDADLATPLEAVDDFVAVLGLRPEVDLVLGSRVMLMGRDIRRNAARHYVSRVFATAASLALDLPVYDTQCGAKLLRVTPQVAGLLDEPFRSAWVFDVELIARYLALDAGDGPPRATGIYELTLRQWHEVPGSKLRWADFLRSFVEVFGVWRRRRRGRN